jgi:hypothetical protein
MAGHLDFLFCKFSICHKLYTPEQIEIATMGKKGFRVSFSFSVKGPADPIDHHG